LSRRQATSALERGLVGFAEQIHEGLADKFFFSAVQQSGPGRVGGDDDAVMYIHDGVRRATHQAAQFLFGLPRRTEHAFKRYPQPVRMQFARNHGTQTVAMGQRDYIAGAAFHRDGDGLFIDLVVYEEQWWLGAALGDAGSCGSQIDIGAAGKIQDEFRGQSRQLLAEQLQVVDPRAVHRVTTVAQNRIDRCRVIVAAADDDQRNANGVAQPHTCRIFFEGSGFCRHDCRDYVTAVRLCGQANVASKYSSGVLLLRRDLTNGRGTR
jgi:hypothetical protein